MESKCSISVHALCLSHAGGTLQDSPSRPRRPHALTVQRLMPKWRSRSALILRARNSLLFCLLTTRRHWGIHCVPRRLIREKSGGFVFVFCLWLFFVCVLSFGLGFWCFLFC